jgi:cardiolipin synthase
MNGITLFLVIHVTLEVAILIRVLLRPHREPASRIAWFVVILSLPVLGMVAYILFGEVNIGRRRVARLREVLSSMPPVAAACADQEQNLKAVVPPCYEHLFRVGSSISGFDPIGGNAGRLLPDSNAAIDAMVADIDAATEHVHLLF